MLESLPQEKQCENPNWVADKLNELICKAKLIILQQARIERQFAKDFDISTRCNDFQIPFLMLGEVQSTGVVRGEGRHKIVYESETKGVLIAEIKSVDYNQEYLAELKTLREKIENGAIFPIDIPYCSLNDRGTENQGRIYAKREDFGKTTSEGGVFEVSRQGVIKTMINFLKLYDIDGGFTADLDPKNLVFKDGAFYPTDIEYNYEDYFRKGNSLDKMIYGILFYNGLSISNSSVYSDLRDEIPELETFFEIDKLKQSDIDTLVAVLESKL